MPQPNTDIIAVVDPIEDVEARMEAIAAPLAEADGVARFNELYLAVTRAVAREAGSEVYEDPGSSRAWTSSSPTCTSPPSTRTPHDGHRRHRQARRPRSTTSWPTGASRPRVESPALDLGQRSMARAANAVESHGQHASTPPRRRARRAVERDPRPLCLGARFADT
jgi:hypothetical protein